MELKLESKQSLVMSTKALIKNSKITVKTIVTSTTHKNLKNNNNYDLEEMDYGEVQKWTKKNHKSLFHGHNNIQINVLTENGWRAGEAFNRNQKIDWYNSGKVYNEAIGDLETIYAMQILLL